MASGRFRAQVEPRLVAPSSQLSVRNSVNRVAVPSDKVRPLFGKYLLRAAQELPK
jgi:hypothetical protein